MITLYGIKNCDTVKKARHWLDSQGIEYGFHDFRVQGLSPERLARWEAELGWETLLNKRGATWRRLEENRRENLDREKALALMLEQPSLIRRPIVESGLKVLIGFTPDYYATEL